MKNITSDGTLEAVSQDLDRKFNPIKTVWQYFETTYNTAKMMKSPQRIRDAEQMLNNLTLCDATLAIPGNFRAKQRRVKHNDSKLVFPVPKRKRQENFSTHYNMHFKNKIGARPSSPRPCSPTRRNNPHPSKVSYLFFPYCCCYVRFTQSW